MVKQLEKMARIWPEIKDTLSVPHSEQDYLKLREILDDLIDEAGNDEHHPLASLIETVGNLVDSYEQEYEPGYQGDPIDALRYLMEEHNLKQSDLEELGSQGAVSEILARKRKLNIRQVNLLSKRFNVSPAVFV